MRFRIFTFICLGLLLDPISAKDDLRLGYLEYPPLIYSEDEHVPKGPVIDFLEQNLADQFNIIWSKIPVGRVRWGFENNVIDAHPFLIRTKEREEWIHYFKKPNFTIQNIICSKNDINRPAASISSISDDMAGATLVYPLNAGYKYSFLSDSRISQINIQFTDYISRSLDLLERKRADYVFYPSRTGLKLGKKTKELSCTEVGGKVGVYFAFSKGNSFAPRVEKIFSEIETQHF